MRLDALPKKFDQLLESLKVREQKQILPPRFVVEEVIKEMTDFIAQTGCRKIFLRLHSRNARAKIDKLTDRQRADFQAQVESAINEQRLSGVSKVDRLFQ